MTPDEYVEEWNRQAALARKRMLDESCFCGTCNEPCGNHSAGCEECLEYAMEARHYGYFILPDDN